MVATKCRSKIDKTGVLQNVQHPGNKEKLKAYKVKILNDRHSDRRHDRGES